MARFENRAQRMEWNIATNRGDNRRATVKREQFEDDYRREGRNMGRGLEGGVEEELDYDVADDFQDDEDSNTFYIDQEEVEEKKLQEVSLTEVNIDLAGSPEARVPLGECQCWRPTAD